MLMQNPEMAQMGQEDPQQFEIMFESEVAKIAAQNYSRISTKQNMA